MFITAKNYKYIDVVLENYLDQILLSDFKYPKSDSLCDVLDGFFRDGKIDIDDACWWEYNSYSKIGKSAAPLNLENQLNIYFFSLKLSGTERALLKSFIKFKITFSIDTALYTKENVEFTKNGINSMLELFFEFDKIKASIYFFTRVKKYIYVELLLFVEDYVGMYDELYKLFTLESCRSGLCKDEVFTITRLFREEDWFEFLYRKLFLNPKFFGGNFFMFSTCCTLGDEARLSGTSGEPQFLFNLFNLTLSHDLYYFILDSMYYRTGEDRTGLYKNNKVPVVKLSYNNSKIICRKEP